MKLALLIEGCSIVEVMVEHTVTLSRAPTSSLSIKLLKKVAETY